MGTQPVDLCDAVAYVDRARRDSLAPENLIPLLAEQAPFLRNRGSAEVERFRGYVLSSFATLGLPNSALEFVLEELETGTEPYTVAAAARALLGAPEQIQAGDLLTSALARIAAKDLHVQFIDFDVAADVSAEETACGIIAETIDALPSARAAQQGGSRAIDAMRAEPPYNCCAGHDHAFGGLPILAPEEIALQDQSGAITNFGGFFRGGVGVLGFFYTRCMNPEKCSLTITQLAHMQRMLRSKGVEDWVRIAAVSYDSDYDLPHRLAAYGRERGLIFGETCRLFRSIDGFDRLQAIFNLGVGFGPQTVNRHQIELLLLDRDAIPFARMSRRKWDVANVVDLLLTKLDQAPFA